MFRKPASVIVSTCVLALLLAGDVALGCPMCKQGAEADPRLPRAFMASILFMMSVPFMLVAGFGFAFWRLSRRADDEVVDE